MGNWRYTLVKGEALREYISNEDQENVLDTLKECYKEIHQNFPSEFEDYELEDVIDDIDNEKDNIENYEDYGLTEDDVRENIDYLLGNFYDLCDALRIWISL